MSSTSPSSCRMPGPETTWWASSGGSEGFGGRRREDEKKERGSGGGVHKEAGTRRGPQLLILPAVLVLGAAPGTEQGRVGWTDLENEQRRNS